MNAFERTLRRVDRFQQHHALAGFPVAVVKKFGDDRAGAQATRVAYHGLFSIFPLLLLLTTLLGFALDGRPELRQDIIDTTVGDLPILGTQLRAADQPLRGSGIGLAIGIAGTLYGSFGLGQTMQDAMNAVWNVPYVRWPNFVFRRVRALGLVAVLGVFAIGSGVLSAWSTLLPSGSAAVLVYAASVAVTLAMFIGAFLVLTAEPLSWRDVWLGAVLATVAWHGLQLAADWYVTRTLTQADDTYGFFAVVIALLSFLYLVAQLTLLAAEVNVVRRNRLWPRSMTQPPLTTADRQVYERLASMEVRRPEYEVTTVVLPAAYDDPLAEDEAGAEPATAERS